MEVGSGESVSINCSSPCGLHYWTYNLQRNHSGLAVIEVESQQRCNSVTGQCTNSHVVRCSDAQQDSGIVFSLRLRPLKDLVLQCTGLLDMNNVGYPFYSHAVLIRIKKGNAPTTGQPYP